MLNINDAIVSSMQKKFPDLSVSKNSIVGTIPMTHQPDRVFSVAVESATLWEMNPQHEYDVILSCMQIEDMSSRLTPLPSSIKWGGKFTEYIRKVNTPASNIEKCLDELKEVYGGAYEGYLGVDMMICRDGDEYYVHPCVEVNLRMNMGVVSRLLYDRFLSDGVKGTYVIEYFPNPGDAWAFHERMKHDYPVKTNGKRIKSGYLSLSPVFLETSYLIFIIV